MPLERLAVFVAEIPGLQAEESLRRVDEIRVAHAPAGEHGERARAVERKWREKARRAERLIKTAEKRRMSKEEYDAMLSMAGVARREWVVKDGE